MRSPFGSDKLTNFCLFTLVFLWILFILVSFKVAIVLTIIVLYLYVNPDARAE